MLSGPLLSLFRPFIFPFTIFLGSTSDFKQVLQPELAAISLTAATRIFKDKASPAETEE